ncbi:unnamed protein product [Heligmosomoides polygyrus]|uniref:Lipid-A-disaccharide synthase n=1 Tax=Heligmosomoides polygyrus TaxID=6339 RepID=A0A3P7WU46_HELPZ|nr:unnamed protein product [Heligmosomoides polygyrus]
MESLNADIVLHMCPHMDLGTLSCFAVAYPKWQSLALRFIQKRTWGIRAIRKFATCSPKPNKSFGELNEVLEKISPELMHLETDLPQEIRKTLQTIISRPGSSVKVMYGPCK